ncbi:MAG: nucleoside deaminase [Nanoarchaeota archaeon]
MHKAIEIAKESAIMGDYALGSVIVKDGKIIATGKTNLKHENDPTVHAEIVAIRKACKELNSKYLENCVLYTTCEPCPMCSSAAVWAKMKGIVFGAFIQDAKLKSGNSFSWRQIDISCKQVLEKGTPKLELVEGFLREECKKLFDLSQ